MSTENDAGNLCVYIDGFNLYHAIVDLGDSRLKWLNFRVLANSLKRGTEELADVYFFTAVLPWDKAKQARHQNFMAACTAVGVKVIQSSFKKARRYCRKMDRYCDFDEEKQTDVAFSLSVVSDAMDNRFDRAALITADSDQIPTIRMLRARFPSKRVSLVAPPGRLQLAREMGGLAHDRAELTRGHLATCRLPREVRDDRGRLVAQMPALYEPISN